MAVDAVVRLVDVFGEMVLYFQPCYYPAAYSVRRGLYKIPFGAEVEVLYLVRNIPQRGFQT